MLARDPARRVAFGEFSLMSEEERRSALWWVDQYETIGPSDMGVMNPFRWNWHAANDNNTTCHLPELLRSDHITFLSGSKEFRELLVLWRECQYNMVLTKLAFPL